MNEIEKLIKRSHLKNFVKKDVAPTNKSEEKRELIRERAARLDRSSGIINIIVSEEAE